jgi:foldase protein PrsA
VRRTLLLGASAVVGLLAGEGFCRIESSRKLIAITAHRAGLLQDVSLTNELVRQENLRSASRSEAVSSEDIERELNLLRDQFGDENVFGQALKFSGFTLESLRTFVTDHLRARRWIEEQIAPDVHASATDVQRFYDTNASRFAQPLRFRVSHIFLAAPEGYPIEVITEKQSEIQGLSVRILAGEKFSDLVAEASEDEATKTRGGDLDYFSVSRMPPEFVAELEKLHVGEVSAPIRSHLGFHIVQLTDVKDPRQMSFEETQREIAARLINEKRTAAVARLTERLSAQ